MTWSTRRWDSSVEVLFTEERVSVKEGQKWKWKLTVGWLWLNSTWNHPTHTNLQLEVASNTPPTEKGSTIDEKRTSLTLDDTYLQEGEDPRKERLAEKVCGNIWREFDVVWITWRRWLRFPEQHLV